MSDRLVGMHEAFKEGYDKGFREGHKEGYKSALVRMEKLIFNDGEQIGATMALYIMNKIIRPEIEKHVKDCKYHERKK